MKPEKKVRPMIRLNKFIADSGIASRRKAEEFILQGRIAVNGKIVKILSTKIDPENDEVSFDGEKIRPKKHLYFLLNKTKGFITSTSDDKNRKTVVELIKTNGKIFPVGRLDYNTTGVLLLTNDGNFSNLLTHPGNKVPRKYETDLDRPLEEKDKIKLLKGVYIEGVRGKFTKLNIKPKSGGKTILVEAVEGRNHFVKKMFRTLGYNVTSLDRVSYGIFKTDIPVGSYRPIATTEIQKAMEMYG